MVSQRFVLVAGIFSSLAIAACASNSSSAGDVDTSADEVTVNSCSDGSLGGFQVYVKRTINAHCSDYEGNVGAGGRVDLGKFEVNTRAGGIGLRSASTVALFESKVNGGIQSPGSPILVRSTGTDVSGSTSHTAISTQMDCLSSWLSKGLASATPAGSSFSGATANLYFYSMSHQTLASKLPLTFSYPAGSTVVINVTGSGAATLARKAAMATPSIPVVFNFVDATSLSISEIELAGTILAPKADVTFTNGLLKGNLFAGSLAGGVSIPAGSSSAAATTHCATLSNQAGQINYASNSLPEFLSCR